MPSDRSPRRPVFRRPCSRSVLPGILHIFLFLYTLRFLYYGAIMSYFAFSRYICLGTYPYVFPSTAVFLRNEEGPVPRSDRKSRARAVLSIIYFLSFFFLLPLRERASLRRAFARRYASSRRLYLKFARSSVVILRSDDNSELILMA